MRELSKPQNSRVAMAVTVSLLLAFGGSALYLGVVEMKKLHEHEKVIEACHLMAVVVAAYVEETGHWPVVIEDLDRIGWHIIGGSEWPADREDVLRRVTIDFGLMKQDIASMTPGNFQAIRPIDTDQISISTRQNVYERLLPTLETIRNAPAQVHP